MITLARLLLYLLMLHLTIYTHRAPAPPLHGVPACFITVF
jgi:hypothetical protein